MEKMGEYDYYGIGGFIGRFGTTGPCGGDAGHGGNLVIEIECNAGACITTEITGDEGGPQRCDTASRIEIIVQGDSEMEGMIQFIEFLAAHLRRAHFSECENYSAKVSGA